MLWPDQIITMKRMREATKEPVGIDAIDHAREALLAAIEALGPLPEEPQTADEAAQAIWDATRHERGH